MAGPLTGSEDAGQAGRQAGSAPGGRNRRLDTVQLTSSALQLIPSGTGFRDRPDTWAPVTGLWSQGSGLRVWSQGSGLSDQGSGTGAEIPVRPPYVQEEAAA